MCVSDYKFDVITILWNTCLVCGKSFQNDGFFICPKCRNKGFIED